MSACVVVAYPTVVNPPPEMVDEAWEMNPSTKVARPLIVVVSVEASPNVVFPSTVKVEDVVVESVTEPTEVNEFTKTSPSVSTKNCTESPTDAEIRLPSATDEVGLITRGAS